MIRIRKIEGRCRGCNKEIDKRRRGISISADKKDTIKLHKKVGCVSNFLEKVGNVTDKKFIDICKVEGVRISPYLGSIKRCIVCDNKIEEGSNSISFNREGLDGWTNRMHIECQERLKSELIGCVERISLKGLFI